jgi:predicted acyltransferase
MWIQKRRTLVERIAGLFSMGALGMMLGLMWNWVFPINKSLWTSSYVLFTAGMAAVALATCMWIIDFKGIRWWTKPLVVFGVNPILAYVGAGLMARLIYSLIRVPLAGESVPLQAAIYRTMYAPFFAPRNASLLFAISFVLVWYGILLVFYRRRWILKV